MSFYDIYLNIWVDVGAILEKSHAYPGNSGIWTALGPISPSMRGITVLPD